MKYHTIIRFYTIQTCNEAIKKKVSDFLWLPNEHNGRSFSEKLNKKFLIKKIKVDFFKMGCFIKKKSYNRHLSKIIVKKTFRWQVIQFSRNKLIRCRA